MVATYGLLYLADHGSTDCGLKDQVICTQKIEMELKIIPKATMVRTKLCTPREVKLFHHYRIALWLT